MSVYQTKTQLWSVSISYNFVSKANGSARVARADRGVENCIIAGMQRYFHRKGNQNNCFLFGRSTANQRIEAWWSYLRKNCLQCWMKYFKDLCDRDIFDDSNVFHTECLRFFFLGTFQDELSSWRFGTTIAYGKLKTLSRPV